MCTKISKNFHVRSCLLLPAVSLCLLYCSTISFRLNFIIHLPMILVLTLTSSVCHVFQLKYFITGNFITEYYIRGHGRIIKRDTALGALTHLVATLLWL